MQHTIHGESVLPSQVLLKKGENSVTGAITFATLSTKAFIINYILRPLYPLLTPYSRLRTPQAQYRLPYLHERRRLCLCLRGCGGHS
jgi:hypothetical protein